LLIGLVGVERYQAQRPWSLSPMPCSTIQATSEKTARGDCRGSGKAA